VRLPVITYHAVGDGPFPLWTPPELFEAHLAAFSNAGYRTMNLAQVAEFVSRGEALPENSIVLTFDDGYESVYTEAFPRLQAKNFTATLFVISGYCRRFNQWPTQGSAIPIAPILSWEQVSELAANGWEIGAHTHSHAPLRMLRDDQAEMEILESKDRIEKRIAGPVRVFAYPYGDVTPSILGSVRKNFSGAAGTQLGFVEPRSNPFILPRIDAII